MHPHAALINRFYEALARRDAVVMADCYHPEVEFSDPVFPRLIGKQAGNMWRMLCERGKDLRVEYRDVTANDDSGQAHWEAWYTFSATGRKVHNTIDAHFEFRDGKILRHRDTFSFPAWARQALGTTGFLLGWTGLVRQKVQAQAARSLEAFGRRE
jgi:ketosteroid isomerase-like protein